METAKKEIYIKTNKPQPDLSEPYDGDTLEGNNEFMKELQENESQRVEMNEKFISMLENDLEYYDMMLVEAKTIKDIDQVELLVLMRLKVLEKSINVTDDDIDRFQNLIDSAKQSLRIITVKKSLLQSNEVKKYDFDQKVFEIIFNYCTSKKPIFTNSRAEFYLAVETANFSILTTTGRNKGKLQNLIHFIVINKGLMDGNWYSDVVDSLGIEKSDCKNNSENWYDGLEKACEEQKKQLEKT